MNLSAPEGAALLLRLAERADVLVENFRPGTLERWGVGPEEMHRVNPGLVIARITGFGRPARTPPAPGSARWPRR
ncbi:CoA transferase [Micromonospora sp. BRA006-A]|nr:CoA transferase [Micromonospora sp. BRA006-A]